jgi:hypothetical protein
MAKSLKFASDLATIFMGAGAASHGRRSHVHAPQYISFVILHTTKNRGEA